MSQWGMCEQTQHEQPIQTSLKQLKPLDVRQIPAEPIHASDNDDRPHGTSPWNHFALALRLEAGTLCWLCHCYCVCQKNETDRRPWTASAIWVLSGGGLQEASPAPRPHVWTVLECLQECVWASSFLTELQRLAACLRMQTHKHTSVLLTSFVPERLIAPEELKLGQNDLAPQKCPRSKGGSPRFSQGWELNPRRPWPRFSAPIPARFAKPLC